MQFGKNSRNINTKNAIYWLKLSSAQNILLTFLPNDRFTRDVCSHKQTSKLTSHMQGELMHTGISKAPIVNNTFFLAFSRYYHAII